MRSKLTVQEQRTTLAPDEVLKLAKGYFARRSALYAAFLDQEGPHYCTFRGQGGEEIVIGVSVSDGATRVTGSSYLFDMQIARFFSTLPAADSAGTAAIGAGSVAAVGA